MAVEHLIAFNIALLVALMSPGPGMLFCIQATLSDGRRAGIFAGYGLALMATTWVGLALLGIEAIFTIIPFTVVPWAYALVKGIAGAYLIYIAWRIWIGARTKPEEKTKPQTRLQTYSFIHGFIINVLNPKSVLFAAAVLIVIFPKNITMLENAIIVLNHLFIEVVFYTLLAVTMSTQAAKASYLRAKVYIDRTTSFILGGFGLRIFISE